MKVTVGVEKVIRMTKKDFAKSIKGSGIEFYFLKLNGKVNSVRSMGVKVVHTPSGTKSPISSRDNAYNAQLRAFKAGIGPPVGMKVIIVTESKRKGSSSSGRNYYYTKNIKVYYGYETGIVDTRGNRTFPDTLRKKLARLKLDGDLHDGNIGKWKGKKVAIDFGTHSKAR
jgi:hypothetical protein